MAAKFIQETHRESIKVSKDLHCQSYRIACLALNVLNLILAIHLDLRARKKQLDCLLVDLL